MLPTFFKISLVAIPVMISMACITSKSSAEDQFSIIKNIPYKTGSNLTAYEKERCILDLYIPKSKKDCPVVVWFHGGGLEGGSKDDAVEIGKFFAGNGIAAAVASYRLFPEAKYPTYIKDAAASVAWTINNLEKYGLNKSCPVFISGHSAGAFLSAILGMDVRFLKKDGIDIKRISGIIPVSGQVFTHYTIRRERGIPDPQNTPTIDEAAPCFYVRKDTPPMLMICGDNDWPARAEENKYFVAMLKSLGNTKVEYQEFKDRDHGTIVGKIPEPNDPEAKAILDFIEKYKIPVK